MKRSHWAKKKKKTTEFAQLLVNIENVKYNLSVFKSSRSETWRVRQTPLPRYLFCPGRTLIKA
jgi:hypothetical protein